jgi:hypothetical protein
VNFDEIKFQRVFSKSMYKDLKLPLAEMTFTKDFVNDKRGDLYPVIAKDNACVEQIESNRYHIKSGTVERMFTRFFPYATYEISFSNLSGGCGFVFHLADQKAELICKNDTIYFSDGENEQNQELCEQLSCTTMIVSCRPKAFDIYFKQNDKPTYFYTFTSNAFASSNKKNQFDSGYVSVAIKEAAIIDSVSSYIDCGISQADIRAICYENGEPIFENGKIYFTASVRIQEGGFQGIFSLTPTLCNIEFTGALFFDCGDGFWRNYLASSLLYNRYTKEWYIWTSSFEHKHILCYASFVGEPRFGVNVIDVTMMKPSNTNDVTAFLGFNGDEDPDFYYNEQEKLWYMAICRISPTTKNYRYMFFKSKNPFSDYTYIGQGYEGAETGGSFVNIEKETVFVCGNDFKKRANYRIYTKDGMHEAKFNFDDGGFRGWGTIIPVVMGSRKRYFWLTFDRHNGSSYNWSYGNIYCFEAEI